MIMGRKLLKQIYNKMEKDQYQPAGIDLTLKSISDLKHNNGTVYGLLTDAKVLPISQECEIKSVLTGGMAKKVYMLEPHKCYLATTNEKIKIPNDAGQLYLPRSSLLRAGIDVRTAFGDPGFCGHLTFLVINHTDYPFALEQNVRFAQLVHFGVTDVDIGYDGDYNE